MLVYVRVVRKNVPLNNCCFKCEVIILTITINDKLQSLFASIFTVLLTLQNQI